MHDDGDTLRKFVAARPCPLLVVPKEFNLPPKKIIFPYDPSPESARAMRAFTLLNRDISENNEVILLRVESNIDEGMRCIKRQAKYLEAWGFDVQRSVEPGEPRKIILQTAQANKPCIVVLGAYNHNPISEIFFGSTTMALIADGTIPLFIAA